MMNKIRFGIIALLIISLAFAVSSAPQDTLNTQQAKEASTTKILRDREGFIKTYVDEFSEAEQDSVITAMGGYENLVNLLEGEVPEEDMNSFLDVKKSFLQKSSTRTWGFRGLIALAIILAITFSIKGINASKRKKKTTKDGEIEETAAKVVKDIEESKERTEKIDMLLAKIKTHELNKTHLIRENAVLLTQFLDESVKHKETAEKAVHYYAELDKALASHNFKTIDVMEQMFKKDLEKFKEWETAFKTDLAHYDPSLPKRLEMIITQMQNDSATTEFSKDNVIQAIAEILGDDDKVKKHLKKVLDELSLINDNKNLLYEIRGHIKLDEEMSKLLKDAEGKALKLGELLKKYLENHGEHTQFVPHHADNYDSNADTNSFIRSVSKDYPELKDILVELKYFVSRSVYLERVARSIEASIQKENELFQQEAEAIKKNQTKGLRDLGKEKINIYRYEGENFEHLEKEDGVLHNIAEETHKKAVNLKEKVTTGTKKEEKPTDTESEIQNSIKSLRTAEQWNDFMQGLKKTNLNDGMKIAIAEKLAQLKMWFTRGNTRSKWEITGIVPNKPGMITNTIKITGVNHKDIAKTFSVEAFAGKNSIFKFVEKEK